MNLLLYSIAAAVFLIAIMVIRLFSFNKKLTDSFTKIGFVIRQDYKSYFQSTEEKSAEIKSRLAAENQEIIKMAVAEALKNQTEVISKSLITANQEADIIIKKSKDTAASIIKEAQKQREKIISQAVSQSVYVLENTLSQFVNQKISFNDQEKITIKKITEEFFEDLKNG